MKNFSGIGIMQRMATITAEQPTTGIFAIAQWIEELQDDKERIREDLSKVKTENEKNLRYIGTMEAQRRRLLERIEMLEDTIGRLESVVYKDEC